MMAFSATQSNVPFTIPMHVVLHCCLQTLNDTKQRLQEVQEENAREKQDWQQQQQDWQQQHHDWQQRQQDWQQQHQDWQQRQQDWQQQQQLLEKQLHDLLQRADIHAHIIVVSAANELARLKEQLNVAQARLAHHASGAEQLQQSVVRLTAAVCAADARAVAAEASSIEAAAVAADASSDAHASAALLEQERQLNAALLEETELLHQHVAIADAATMAAMADAEDKGVRLRACMADSKQLQKECSNLMKRVARRDQALQELRAAQTAQTAIAQEQEQPPAAASNCEHACSRPHQTVQLCHTQVAAHGTAAYKTSYLLRALQLLVACQLSFNKVQHAITSSLGLHLMPGQELIDRVPSGKTLKRAMDKIVETVNKLQARELQSIHESCITYIEDIHCISCSGGPAARAAGPPSSTSSRGAAASVYTAMHCVVGCVDLPKHDAKSQCQALITCLSNSGYWSAKIRILFAVCDSANANVGEQGGVVKLLSAAAISAGHQQHPIYVVHCYEHILHNAVRHLCVHFGKSAHMQRQGHNSALCWLLDHVSMVFRKHPPPGSRKVEEACLTRWGTYCRIAVWVLEYYQPMLEVLQPLCLADSIAGQQKVYQCLFAELLKPVHMVQCAVLAALNRDSQGAVGEPVTAEQVDELVLELVGVLGEYYTKRMHFLGDFPYLAAALGDPSPAARQRGASRVLQYLSATGPALDMEDDPLQLFKLQADLQELEATGIITAPLEQLLSRYFRPVHITNAASETALKPLNNDMVSRMKEEGVSGRIKMTVEDTNSWLSDYLSDDALGGAASHADALGAAASHAGALGGAASHAGALGGAASHADALGAAASHAGALGGAASHAGALGGAASHAGALGAAASPLGAQGGAASPAGAQGGVVSKPLHTAKQASQTRKVLRAMQRITLPVKLPTREEYSSAASARDQNTARQQRLADITNKLQHLEDTARQVYNRQQPHLPALPQKGIMLNHLKQLCVRLNLATKGFATSIMVRDARALMGLPILPSSPKRRAPISQRRVRHIAAGSNAQGPVQWISMAEVQLAHSNWSALLHLLHLAAFMGRRKPDMAVQLAGAGAARLLLDVLRAVLCSGAGPGGSALLLGEACGLLLVLAQADAAACARHVLSGPGVGLLLLAAAWPQGDSQDAPPSAAGHQALRGQWARWVLPAPAAAVYCEQLLTHGALPALPLLLHDPRAGCDLVLVQDVLLSLLGLMQAEVALGGQQGGGGGGVPAHAAALPGAAAAPDLPAELSATGPPECPHHQVRPEAGAEGGAGQPSALLHEAALQDDEAKQQLVQQGVLQLVVQAVQEGGTSGLAPPPAPPPLSVPQPQPDQGPPQPYPPPLLLDGRLASAWERLLAVLLIRTVERRQAETPGSQQGVRRAARRGVRAGRPSPLPPLGLPPLTALVSWLLLPVLSPGPAPPEALGLQLEAVACLRALLADQEQGQAAALQAGLLPPLLQLVREAELQLAWQAVEVVGTLAASAPLRQQLVDEGAVEALVELLQECGDALHLLTVRKQLAEHAVRGSSPASPAPHSAFAHPGQAAGAPGRRRVQLVGLQAVGVRGSACLYAPHAPCTLCDYCCPSACIRALLQLAGPAGGPPAPGGGRVLPGSRGSSSSGGGGAGAVCRPADVAARLSRCGALYCLFLLLHHELCGAHHSKLASSLVLLLNWMLASGLPLQDEVRKAGGLAILVALLQQAVGSSGITDIFQLRVLLCSALERCLAGNPANQLLAREHGLIPPLLALLGGAVEQQQLHVLDDDEQVSVAALELLAACCQGCSGNQAAVVAGGGLRLLHGLLTREHPDCSVPNAAHPTPVAVCVRVPPPPPPPPPPPLRAAAARPWCALPCAAWASWWRAARRRRAALMGGGALPRLVQAAEAAPDSPLAHCEGGAGGGRQGQGAGAGAGLPCEGGCSALSPPLSAPPASPAAAAAAAAAAAGLVYTCIALVRHWPEGKARVLAAGLLPLLLRMLAAQAPACVMAAAQGLYCVCVGDVDLQNEGGGAGEAAQPPSLPPSPPPPPPPAALTWQHDRKAGAVASRGALQVLQGLLSGPAPLAVPAAWLACCLLHGNSYVKNAARQAGLPRLLVRAVRCAGLEQPQLTVACCHALAQLSSSNHANQEAVADEGGVEAVLLLLRALLRPGDPGTPAASPRQPARPPSSLPPTQPPPPDPRGGPSGGAYRGQPARRAWEAAPPPPAAGSEGSASCPAPALAAGPATPVKQQGGWGAGGAAAAVPLAVAKSQPAVLDAALRLLAALMEFNATNQQLARESGCLSLLTHLLLAAAAEPELGALRGGGLLPPLAAACAAVAAAAQDCEDNQQHLVQAHEDLAPALFRLLTVDEPYVALEVARALEFTAIRSDLVHDMREERVEFEADAVRSLVRVLHSRGPRSPAAASSSNGAVDSRRARNPADGLDPTAPPLVASEVVREAARVMLSIVAAVGGSSDASAGTGAVADAKPGATAGTKLSAAFALFRRAKPSSGPPGQWGCGSGPGGGASAAPRHCPAA
ncbi:hypothetical protein QJQ45_014014 [Haematococcus lacustris]|nr:hypothetical protein QJQ45_014014 [Haematococcus lacustris]